MKRLLVGFIFGAVLATTLHAGAGGLKFTRYDNVRGRGPDRFVVRCENWRISSRSTLYLANETIDADGNTRAVYRCIGR